MLVARPVDARRRRGEGSWARPSANRFAAYAWLGANRSLRHLLWRLPQALDHGATADNPTRRRIAAQVVGLGRLLVTTEAAEDETGPSVELALGSQSGIGGDPGYRKPLFRWRSKSILNGHEFGFSTARFANGLPDPHHTLILAEKSASIRIN